MPIGTPINFINGTAGDDILFDTSNPDAIAGNDGNDTVVASVNAGNDAEWDTFDGGAGTDTLDYSDAGTGINGSLDGGVVNRVVGWGGIFSIDFATGFENVIGTGFADTVAGSTAANRLESGAGNDSLLGGNGNDTLRAGDGADTINGGSGRDLIVGGDGADRLRGGSGSDNFRWEAGDYGADVLVDFVLGTDQISFGRGFLATDPAERSDYADMLSTLQAVQDTLLYAETADGVRLIARFQGVDRTALQEAIDDGSLFAIQRGDLAGGGPGGVTATVPGLGAPPSGGFDLIG